MILQRIHLQEGLSINDEQKAKSLRAIIIRTSSTSLRNVLNKHETQIRMCEERNIVSDKRIE